MKLGDKATWRKEKLEANKLLKTYLQNAITNEMFYKKEQIIIVPLAYVYIAV